MQNSGTLPSQLTHSHIVGLHLSEDIGGVEIADTDR